MLASTKVRGPGLAHLKTMTELRFLSLTLGPATNSTL